MDNVLIAFEVSYSISCHKGINGSVAIKQELSKAYDRVEWPFL